MDGTVPRAYQSEADQRVDGLLCGNLLVLAKSEKRFTKRGVADDALSVLETLPVVSARDVLGRVTWEHAGAHVRMS